LLHGLSGKARVGLLLRPDEADIIGEPQTGAADEGLWDLELKLAYEPTEIVSVFPRYVYYELDKSQVAVGVQAGFSL
jgi:hypothetical protein